MRAHARSGGLVCALAATLLLAGGAIGPGTRAHADQAPAGGTGGDSCPASTSSLGGLLAGGTPQTAKLGSQFAAPLAVALANTDGCPVTTAVAGIPVTYTAPASGASAVFAASGSSSVTVGTDAGGSAAAQMLSAGELAGSYVVTASSAYGTVAFSLTNSAAGIPVTITPLAPVGEHASAGTRYKQPLAVRVLDSSGRPVVGANVTFSLSSGAGAGAGAGADGSASAGASFDDGTAQAIETTDANGVATSPSFTANASSGTFSATAAVAHVPEPALFALDNLPARGDTIACAVPSSKLAPADGSASAGASFDDGTAQAIETTDANGVATSPSFTANASSGTFSATAAVAHVPEPALFALDNLPARGDTIASARRGTPTAKVGTRYADRLRVIVRDRAGHPVAGATVSFTLGSGAAAAAGGGGPGASFSGSTTQATERTGSHGIATSPVLTANDEAGSFTASASTSGGRSVTVLHLRNSAGAPAAITAGVGAAQSTAAGTVFAIPLAVTVTDAHGNRAAGVAVTFAAPSSGVGGSFAGVRTEVTVRTSVAGIAVAPPFTANGSSGGYIVTATVKGVRAIAFALVNDPS